ncbi:ATPase [Sinirhodobacter populi]|uniref:ATPase n=1 Tax=Paenirhodobacter populi TaxID=2306993 RepID=A0A443K9Q0_9RHOB|nr:AAA family ATPase [Sinirhodobacter populi]RWR29470.1 ATPase [Sinirhodobacter populi]
MTDDPIELAPRLMPPDERFGPPPEDNPFVERDAARRSRFFSAADLDGKPVPPRLWLVQDLVPVSTVTLLGGDGGTGKSLLALQLAVAVASDAKWVGRSVAHGGALFISAEDDTAELHRRLSDVVRASGVALPDLDRLTLRSLAGEDALFATLDRGAGVLAPSALYAEVEARIDADRPALVVLDTLADLFPGNENDRAQARQFIGMLRGLAIRHECAVMLLAHPSLTGLNSGSGTSGSTGWNNSVRSRLYLERVVQDGYEANPDARILSSKKANHARVGVEINMAWRDGAFVVEGGETSLDRMAASSKAQRVFLKLLRLFREQGRKVNTAGGQTYAPTVFASHPDAEGVSRVAFRGAMESLLAGGKIRVAEEGPASKRRTFLEVVA